MFFYALFNSDQWQQALPALVNIIMSYAFLYTRKNTLTFLIGLCSVLWLIVGVSVGSISIIALEIVSLILLLYRYYIVKREEYKDNFNIISDLDT